MSEPISLGAAAPTDRLLRTLAQPIVRLAGLPQEVLFAGLAPGLVGVYQINVQVGADAEADSTVSLSVEIAGSKSNTVTVGVGR